MLDNSNKNVKSSDWLTKGISEKQLQKEKEKAIKQAYRFLKKKRRECAMRNHTWVITKSSNVLQQDSMGYPLRLFICECKNCGMSDQKWIDVAEEELEELETGKSVLLEWK